MKKRMRDYEGKKLASEIIREQANRTKFWFCAFLLTVLVFIINCQR